jgi:hypothetical protein
MSKNQSGFAFGLLSFEHWLLRNDPDFVGENTINPSAHRNSSRQNSNDYFHHIGIALHKYYNINQIHSQINSITLKHLSLWKLQKFLSVTQFIYQLLFS